MNVKETTSWWRRSAAAAGALAIGLVALVVPAAAANIDPTVAGSITVHKHAGQSGTPVEESPTGTGGVIPTDPIAGVGFTVYRITDIDLGTNAGWSTVNGWASATPTIIEGATPTVNGLDTVETAVLPLTNSAGIAASGALPVGAYVVVETGPPATVGAPAAPFVVTIPTPHNGGWVYDVNVFPKNTLNPLTPTKAVSSPSGLGLGATVNFPVTTPIRNLADPTNFSHYWVQDVMDSRLTNVGVSFVTIDGVEVDSALYTVDPASDDNGNLVSLHFNQAGLAFLKTQGGESLVTTFTGTVNTVGDGEITNTAFFDADTIVAEDPPATPSTPPTDPEEPTYPGSDEYPGVPTDPVQTNWGDLKVSKVNAADTEDALAGAVFEVYAATNPYAANQAGAGPAVGGPISVNGATTFTSGADGVVNILGLFVSDSETSSASTTRWYVLREVTAPTGYVLPTSPYTVVQVQVGTTQATTIDATVTNTQQSVPQLPLTGANGQLLMTLAGIALLLVAVGGALAVRNRSKHAE